MRTILKFKLKVGPWVQEIEMPDYSSIIDIQMKNNELWLWAMCDVETTSVKKYEIACITTGGIFDIHFLYLKTLHLVNMGEDLVLHFFLKNP